MCVCMCVLVNIYICKHIYIPTCVCVRVCLYIYIPGVRRAAGQ